MPDRLTLSLSTLCGFLLVLARVTGALSFVPFPGFKAAQLPRAVLAVGFTVALFGRWPQIDVGAASPGVLAAWVAAEAALGISIGVVVALVLEAVTLAAQVLGPQAGYAYASTIDPNTEADSGVLLILAQLMAGLLFFSLGLDRQILRLFAESLERTPPGEYVLGVSSAAGVIRLGSGTFSVGLRLAFPVVALLIAVDLALALLGRVNTQLQLLSLAFPVKMLTGLALLAATSTLFPRVVSAFASEGWKLAGRLLGQ